MLQNEYSKIKILSWEKDQIACKSVIGLNKVFTDLTYFIFTDFIYFSRKCVIKKTKHTYSEILPPSSSQFPFKIFHV